MKGLYAYIRVSTVKQGERGSSLQEQKSAIEGYALRHGFLISEWFEEKETAAKRGRPVFNRMIKLLRQSKAIGVIIHKIDRSARNLRDWADLNELLESGVELHFAHESLDLSSRGGRLSADIQAVVAADFIRNLREEVRKGFNGRLKQGLYPLPAPIGYRDQGRGLAKLPDPITAPLVRRAFELYATGQHSLLTLGEELHRVGLRNKHGGPVSRNGYSILLNNEFYIGIIHIRRTGARYQGQHRPLVTKQLFDRVQMLLSGKTRNAGVKYASLYRRMLRCKHCGYNVIAERQKGQLYYRCHTPTCPTTCLREDDIDQQIEQAIDAARINPDEFEELTQTFLDIQKSAGNRKADTMQSLGLTLSQVNSRMDRLTDAYVERLIDERTFQDRQKRLLHERADVQARIEGMTKELDGPVKEANHFLELVKALSSKDRFENQAERRDLIKEATSNLQVDQKHLVVTWQKPFDLLVNRPKKQCSEPQRDTHRTHKDMSTVAERVLKHFTTASLPTLSEKQLRDMEEREHREKYSKNIAQIEAINERRRKNKGDQLTVP